VVNRYATAATCADKLLTTAALAEGLPQPALGLPSPLRPLAAIENSATPQS
jgi:hypothetical protein